MMKIARRLLVGLGWTFLLAGFLGLAPSRAEAQKKRTRLLRLKGVVIKGRIQKPQAFLLMQRASLNYKGLKLKKSFLKKVVGSVRKAPF